MDTQTTQTLETSPTQTIETPKQEPVIEASPDFSWKSQLIPHYANSATINKYPDTKEGFNNSIKSHLELEKLLGHEKIPVPKGPDDEIAMNLFKKAFRVPDKPEGYGLPDITAENMENVKFDKKGFAESIHKYNLTPEQAKGIWMDYTEMVKKQYAGNVKKVQDQVSQSSNHLRAEWGDAYASKIELGQMVINKFAEDKEMNDYVTAQLVTDPRGIKFLAKLGEQFAENRIGDFKYQRHALTPDECKREIESIKNDRNHPYNNEKANKAERDKAIEYVNSLYSVLQRVKG